LRRREIAADRREIAQLRATIQRLEQRVAELERRNVPRPRAIETSQVSNPEAAAPPIRSGPFGL
jgi:cell division protein FtsB